MAYVLCLVYVAVSYIRPGELVPALMPYHLAEVTGIAAAVAAGISLLLRPRPVLNLPIDWCFFGFIVAAFVSNPVETSADRFTEAAGTLLPLVAFYVLIRLTVQTRRQLHALVAVICLLVTFQAATAAAGHAFAAPELDDAGVSAQPGSSWDESPEASEARRFQGGGMYGDPNDLAMSLLIVLPFLFSAVLSNRRGVLVRIGSAAAIGVIGYAFQLTQSRGGFLGLAVLAGIYSYRRIGRVAAVAVLALVVVAGLMMGPSRLQQIDARETSAQGRVEAWAAGLQMLKSHPVLGVGYGQFGVLHDRVAHNSFVHAFAEVGVIGGFLFVGLFYWHFVMSTPFRDVSGAATSALAADLVASAAGATTAALFLSLQNIPILYVPLVLGAARVTAEQQPGLPVSIARALDWAAIGVLSVLTVAATYAAVRVLGAW